MSSPPVVPNQGIQEAISQEVDGAYVIRWTAVAEVLMADGTKMLQLLSSPDLYAWDKVAMLLPALQRAQAKMAQS